MDREADPKPAKKPWKTPAVRTVDLTDEERAQASADPRALLRKIGRDLKSGE